MTLFKVIKNCEINLEYCECGCKGSSVFEKCNNVSTEIAWIYMTEKNIRVHAGHGVNTRVVKTINVNDWQSGREAIKKIAMSLYDNKDSLIVDDYNDLGFGI